MSLRITKQINFQENLVNCVYDDVLGFEQLHKDVLLEACKNPGTLHLAVDTVRQGIREVENTEVHANLRKIERFAEFVTEKSVRKENDYTGGTSCATYVMSKGRNGGRTSATASYGRNLGHSGIS